LPRFHRLPSAFRQAGCKSGQPGVLLAKPDVEAWQGGGKQKTSQPMREATCRGNLTSPSRPPCRLHLGDASSIISLPSHSGRNRHLHHERVLLQSNNGGQGITTCLAYDSRNLHETGRRLRVRVDHMQRKTASLPSLSLPPSPRYATEKWRSVENPRRPKSIGTLQKKDVTGDCGSSKGHHARAAGAPLPGRGEKLPVLTTLPSKTFRGDSQQSIRRTRFWIDPRESALDESGTTNSST
jgi:hypothetical protein